MEGEPTKCPYQAICKCPGGEDWEPVKGFIREEEGVHCLDWNKSIPFSDIPQLRTPGGRHISDAVEAADKLDKAIRKYNRSIKRRNAQRRYEESDKGKATTQRQRGSEKFKLSQQKYYHSEKGQVAHKKRREVVRDFRAAERWLKDHPGMTYEDYLKEEGNGS